MYEPITADVAEELLEIADIQDPQHILKEELINLRKSSIPNGFNSQYLETYQQRIDKANVRYENSLASIKEEIDEIRKYHTDNGQKYTDDQAQQDRTTLERQAQEFLTRSLTIAELNNNDLENYAYAFLEEWKINGSTGHLVFDVPSVSTYHQLVQNKSVFDPAEPLPLLAYGVGLGLLGGLGAVLWRKRTREIARLEREATRLQAKRQYNQAMLLLNNVLDLEELEIMDLEAKLEIEKMTNSRDLKKMKRLLNGIRISKGKLARVNAQKNSLTESRTNQRRLQRLRRRLRPLVR
jgi:hypothetical protein